MKTETKNPNEFGEEIGVPLLTANFDWRRKIAGLDSTQSTLISVLRRFEAVAAWSSRIDWKKTQDFDRKKTGDLSLRMAFKNLDEEFGLVFHMIEQDARGAGSPGFRPKGADYRLSFRSEMFSQDNVVAQRLRQGIIALAEDYARSKAMKTPKIRGRAFGKCWTMKDFTSILKPFSKPGTRKRLATAFIPSDEYTTTTAVPVTDRPMRSQKPSGYQVVEKYAGKSLPNQMSGHPIIHRATYRFLTHDRIDVYDVIPIDPMIVRGDKIRKTPQVFVVIEKRGTPHEQKAAIVDRRGKVLFFGRGIDLLESLAWRIDDHQVKWQQACGRAYVAIKPKSDDLPADAIVRKAADIYGAVGEPPSVEKAKTPLFDLDAVREASRPNTDEEKFDDLIASALANPEIRELAGRLLVKIAEHVRR